MPFSIAYPMVNGHRMSFASLEVRTSAIAKPILGFTSFNFSEELEPGDVYGTAPHKIGRTRGKHNAMCDFELLLLEWEELKATLGAAGVGYGETMVDYFLQFAELPVSPVLTYAIIGCRVTKAEFSNSEGTDATKVKVTCNAMGIVSQGSGSIVAPIRA